MNTVLSLVILVANSLTLPSSMSAVNVHSGSVCEVVEPNTVRYASIVLSALGPCIRLASTISNLLLVASDIDMKYFALLYVAEAKESI